MAHVDNEPPEDGGMRADERPTAAVAVRTAGRAAITPQALQFEADQRKLLGEYVKAQMIDGTDYGVIPGTDRKTLLKPGAEKLCGLFHCVAEYTLEDKTEDWERGLFNYRFACHIVSPSGGVVAEGVGSCSSFEKKYRWRAAERVCPSCGKAAIIKGKAEYGGGYLCWAKRDGCGAKFGDNDPQITNQAVGQVENPDRADLTNTILKMAKKRALIDAAISLARCSDLFTQDVEEQSNDPTPAPAKPQTDPKKEEPKPTNGKRLSREQVAEIMSLVSQKGADKRRFLDWAQGVAKVAIKDYGDIPETLYDQAVALLKQKADKPAIQPEKGDSK